MTKQMRRRFSPEYMERSVARLSESGATQAQKITPFRLGRIRWVTRRDMTLRTPAPCAQPFFDCLLSKAGPDVAGCERLGQLLYEIALVVEAVAEYVGPVHFIPGSGLVHCAAVDAADEVGLNLCGMSHSYEQIEELAPGSA